MGTVTTITPISKTCPHCGEKTYHHAKKLLTINYKGHDLVIEQFGFCCESCGIKTTVKEEQKNAQKSLQSLKARIDGVLTPDEIYQIRRKTLSLTQKEAAELFGGGPNAFSRYENGLLSPPLSTSNLLRLLSKHPELLKEIQ